MTARATITVTHKTGDLKVHVEGADPAVVARLTDMIRKSIGGKPAKPGESAIDRFIDLMTKDNPWAK